MAEETNNLTPEELRKQIQERLEAMKRESAENEQTSQEPENNESSQNEDSSNVENKIEDVTETTDSTDETPIIESNKIEKKEDNIVISKTEVNKMSKQEQSNISTEENGGKKKNGMVALLIVLLVGVIGLFTWQLMQSRQLKSENEVITQKVDDLTEEKAAIKNELKQLYEDYDRVNTSNAELNSQLEEEKQKIAEYLQKIESLQGQADKVDYYRQQLRELQKSKEKFIAQIDSLTNANQSLTAANQQMSSEIENKKSENTQLSEKVETAKRVKGFNLIVEPYTTKGKVNYKSRKIDEFRICITLMENELADAGTKDIYVRIVEPGGDIMVKSKDNFFLDVDSNELAYSAKGSVEYKNVKVETCVTYNGMYGEVIPGNYDFEVYADGQLIGSTNLTLK